MTQRYGILAGLAIAAMAINVQAAPVSGSMVNGGAANGRTATVRMASVTVVDQVPMPGLSAVALQVQDYFNNLSTLQAKFTQTVTGEKMASVGTFYLSRPGKFLWQYDTPVKQRIISTGSAVYYIDQERNQVTQLPMNAGVARLFNAKKFNLAEQGLRATRVRSNSTLMEVEFAVDKKIKTGDQTGLSQLTLTFDRLPGNNLQLRRIDALDTLSVTTRVDFANVQANVALPAKMFNFTPGVYEQRN